MTDENVFETAYDKELTKLVREALGDNADKPFRPFAIYQESLDTVHLHIKDCSTTQIRINRSFAIHKNNYPQEGENPYVGFEIWGVRYFCTTCNREYRGVVSLRSLLEDMWSVYYCPIEYRTEILNMLSYVDSVELPS